MFTGVRTHEISLDPDGFGDQIPVRLRVRADSGDAVVIRDQTRSGSCCFLQLEIFPLRE